MEYARTEQEAIANVLTNLVHADYQNRVEEMTFLGNCFKELGFSDAGFQPCPKDALQAKAYPVLKQMTKEKKRAVSLMMTQLSRSDGDFGPSERAFVMEVLEMCDMPFVHR